MTKGRRSVIIIILFFLIIPQVYAETITVDENGCNYATIQDALDAASDGDTIRIGPGVYRENLLIEKSVEIMGSGEDTVIMAIEPKPTIQVKASNVNIRGVFLFYGLAGVMIEEADHVSIEDCTFEGSLFGISVKQSDANTMIGNTFREVNFTSINLENAVGNRISRNNIDRGSFAISMKTSGENNITDNTLQNIGTGIFLDSCSDNIVKANNFTDCKSGISSKDSGGNVFSNNQVKDTPIFLILFQSSQNEVSNNSFEDKAIYARDILSNDNSYILNGFNVSGAELEFSIFKPSVPVGYDCIGDGLNVTIIPDPLTNTGWGRAEAWFSNVTFGEIDPHDIGFYQLIGSNVSLISTGEQIEGRINVNFTASGGSGRFVLLRLIDIEPPVAKLLGRQSCEVNETVTFDASHSTDNVGVEIYEWNFGDGGNGTGIQVSHAYAKPGNYTISLKVRDTIGHDDVESIGITVEQPELKVLDTIVHDDVESIGITDEQPELIPGPIEPEGATIWSYRWIILAGTITLSAIAFYLIKLRKA